MRQTEKMCFVISPIGSEDSEVRKRANKVFNHIIKPCVESLYKAERADTIDVPGSITNTVINSVVNADLVIADITDHNPNVFYELAIRHAIKKPAIIIAEKGTVFPFDIQDLNVIEFDHKDLDSVAIAKDRLMKAVKLLTDKPEEINTPIHNAIQLQTIENTGTDTEKMLVKITNSLNKINKKIADLEYRITDTTTITPTMTSSIENSYMGRSSIIPSNLIRYDDVRIENEGSTLFRRLKAGTTETKIDEENDES